MAAFLTQPEFAKARSAARDGEVTPELWRALKRMVFFVLRARRFYIRKDLRERLGDWPEEQSEQQVEVLLQEWLMERVPQGLLLQAFDKCPNERALGAYLETSLRRWLIDSARGQEPRLTLNAKKLLISSKRFQRFAGSPGSYDAGWGLAKWSDPAWFPGGREKLLCLADHSRPFNEVPHSEGAKSQPQVLRRAELERLIGELMERAGGLISLTDLDWVFRQLFSWAYSPPRDDEFDPAAPDHPVAALHDYEIDEVARALLPRILAELDATDVQILELRAEERTQLEIANQLEIPRSTVQARLKRIEGVFKQQIPDDEDRQALMARVIDLTF